MKYLHSESIIRCPLCDRKLLCKKSDGLIKYSCLYEYTINYCHIPHYEYIIYADSTIFMQYILEPFYIMSDGSETTIYCLDKYTNGYYFKRELCTRKSSFVINSENLDEIKKKLKLFTTFL